MLSIANQFNERERSKIQNGQLGVTTINGIVVTSSFRPGTGITMQFRDEESGVRCLTMSGIDGDKLDWVAKVVADGINANRTEPRFVDWHDPRHEELYWKMHGPE